MRYLLKSLNVLNLLMAAAAAGFFIYFLNPLLATPVSFRAPAPSDIHAGMPALADAAAKPATGDYASIGEKNLFHPDRIIPEEKKVTTAVTMPRPEWVLHGTLMTNEIKIAYLEDKKAAPKTAGRGAPYLVVKEGDAVSGYTLRQITENMVVMASGEEQMTLFLDELKDRKGEITGPTRPPAQQPAATASPQVATKPAAAPPARPSTVQPSPTAPPSPPRGSASQSGSPAAPSGFSGPPNVQHAPPRPPIPTPSSPARRGTP